MSTTVVTPSIGNLTVKIRNAPANTPQRTLQIYTAEALDSLATNISQVSQASSSPVTPNVPVPTFYQASGNAYTPNFSNGDVQAFTMTGNLAVSAAKGGVSGDEMTIILIQDATGSRTVTWDASFHFSGVFAPDPTPAKATVYKFIWSTAGNMIQSNAPVAGIAWP